MRSRNLIIGIISAAIFIIAVVGLFIFAQVINPPATQVFVAIQDITQGDVLQPRMVNVVSIRGQSLDATYVTENNIEVYANSEVVEHIYPGQFIPIASLLNENNTATSSRIALALSDPEKIAIVVPVSEETSPPNIVAGDYIDLTLAVGSASFQAGNFDTIPEPDGLNEFYFDAPPADLTAVPTLESPFGQPSPTPTAQQPITLPVAKTVTIRARVLQVQYEIIVNPSFSPDTNAQQTVRGDIRALILEVPRESQEIISYGIANGDLRVSVLHPDVVEGKTETAGVSWEDLIAFFRWERRLWAEVQPGDDIYYVPGSASLLLTLQATERPPDPTPIQLSVTPTVGSEESEGAEVTPTPTP